jgi:hypothetical protein
MTMTNQYGFDEIEFDPVATDEQRAVVFRNLEIICKEIGLEGKDKENLGKGAILSIGKPTEEKGRMTGRGQLCFRDGKTAVEVDIGLAQDPNLLAHEMFHLFDARLHKQATGANDYVIKENGFHAMFSRFASAFPSQPLAQQVLSEFGTDREIIAQANIEIEAYNEAFQNEYRLSMFEKLLNGRPLSKVSKIPYFRRPEEVLARAFAWKVSGNDPYRLQRDSEKKADVQLPPNLGGIPEDTDESLAKLTPLILRMARVACGVEPALQPSLGPTQKSGRGFFARLKNHATLAVAAEERAPAKKTSPNAMTRF